MRLSVELCLLAGSALAWSQAPTAPVVTPRGVTNAFTRQPAPSPVAAGGIISISGINLGPADGWTAEEGPLPTQAGDPAIEVRLGGRAMPLYSISPSRIVAQVPIDTPQGVAELVVRRGEQRSAPARFTVTPPMPAIFAPAGGFGAVGVDGDAVTLRVSGLGQTNPPTPPGRLPAPETSPEPRMPMRAFVGGLPAPVTARLSEKISGEFDVKVELPSRYSEGDVINLYAGNSAGNRVTVQSLNAPRVDFVPLPANTNNLRTLTASDLRPGFLVLSGARSAEACWPALIVDFDAAKAESLPGCHTAANPQAQTAFAIGNDGNALAALLGPAEGDAQSGISSRVTLLRPGAEPRVVELDAKASAVTAAPGGNFAAVLAGTPPRPALIDGQSGEISEPVPAGGNAGGGAPGGGFNAANREWDLGDGVKELISQPVAVGPNQQLILAVDSLETVTRAKVAVVNNQGEVLRALDFPEGWSPLLAPIQQAPGAGGGGAPGGGQMPGGGGIMPGGGQVPGANPGIGGAIRFRGAAQFDPVSRNYYVLARAAGGASDAFVRFPLALDQDPQVHAFPDGRFAASCTVPLRLFSVELARRLAVPSSSTPESLIRQSCGASGFVTMDFGSREITETNLPGQGQFNVAGNAANDVNDYIYGSNTDAAQQGRSDTLYVFDGVTNSAFRLDLPPEVASFANLNAFPAMGIVYAQATTRTVGDAGIVVFDLENAGTKLLPTPAGFVSVQPLSVFPATRKLIARGTRIEPAGTQLLLYDLVSGDLQIIANPERVAFVGQVPNTPAQPGQPPQQQPALQNINPKSNAVTMVGFDQQRRPVGVLLVRVH